MVWFQNIVALLAMCMICCSAETTHFTNSPNKLLSSKNFTTYKVEVPGASPITIIEANTPLFHQYYPHSNEQYSQYSIHKQSAENDNYDKSSQSMTITDPNSNSAAEHGDVNEESVTNQSPEHGSSIKTVYSPELLKKFLQDYADKVKHADEYAQDKLNNLKKSVISQNIEEIVAEEDGDIKDDENRRHSMELDNEEGTSLQRKNYQVKHSSQHNSPYNKHDGWVSLDAIPWSSGKVEKWHSGHVQKYPYRPQSNSNRPGGYYIDDEEDQYYPNQNNNFHHHKPNDYGGGPTSHHNYPPTSINHYDHQQNEPADPWYQTQNFNNINQRPSNNPRPWQPDIITDNRPSDFPSHSQTYGNRPPPTRPNDYHYSSSNQNNKYQFHGGNYNTHQHPTLNGDGQWVLVSTTQGYKSYEFPKRNGQRAITFKAQNGASGQSKPNKNTIITSSSAHEHYIATSPTQLSQIGPTSTTQQKGVKLTVMPLYINNSPESSFNVPEYNFNKHNHLQNSYSPYESMLETDPSSQTIEESVSAANLANSANSLKKKRKVRNYSMRKQLNLKPDSNAVFAAVGAGLLPATMAMIAPMVLGKRKKRSIKYNTNDPLNYIKKKNPTTVFH